MVGYCGKTVKEAGLTTAREYNLLRECEERRERRRWEMARWQCFIMMQLHPYIKPAHKPATPEAWAPFAWEKEAQLRRAADTNLAITEQEQSTLDAMLNDFIRAKDNGQDR